MLRVYVYIILRVVIIIILYCTVPELPHQGQPCVCDDMLHTDMLFKKSIFAGNIALLAVGRVQFEIIISVSRLV